VVCQGLAADTAWFAFATWLGCAVLVFLHWLCLMVSIVVVSHGCVRSCVEGWCLIAYWVAAAGVVFAFAGSSVAAVHACLHAMFATAIALPLVATARWLVGRLHRARLSAA
jgi:hypothetical protein